MSYIKVQKIRTDSKVAAACLIAKRTADKSINRNRMSPGGAKEGDIKERTETALRRQGGIEGRQVRKPKLCLGNVRGEVVHLWLHDYLSEM